MKRLLSMLVIPLVLLGTPALAGAVTPTTTAFFDGIYSFHGSVTVTGNVAACGKGGTVPESSNLVVRGGEYKGRALHFIFSSHQDASVANVVDVDGIPVTIKYTFSINFSNVTVMQTVNGHGTSKGCTATIHGSGRGTRIAK